MPELLYLHAAAVLLSVAGGLLRIVRGPAPADRMMGAQLIGTGGIAVLLLIAGASGQWAVVDVALVLALLAALAAIAFAKAVTPDGAGDPEEGGRA